MTSMMADAQEQDAARTLGDLGDLVADQVNERVIGAERGRRRGRGRMASLMFHGPS